MTGAGELEEGVANGHQLRPAAQRTQEDGTAGEGAPA